MDPVALAKVLRGSDGPVVRQLMQDGQAVKAEARHIVRVHKPTPREKRSRLPGTLRDSIVMRVRPGPVIEVGSEDKIALIEHEGTEAHSIAPKHKPALVFWSGKYGRVIKLQPGRAVNHPGTTGSKYLTRALAVLRSRY